MQYATSIAYLSPFANKVERKGGERMNCIHEGHRLRTKRRFLKEGLENLPAHNVLELLLYYGVPRRDTNPLAHTLLERFGSLASVLDAPAEELQKIPGISENIAVLLKLIPALSSRYCEEKNDLSDTGNVMEALAHKLMARYIGKTTEIAYLACLDNRLKILFMGPISEGSVGMVNILTRKVAEIALRHNASGVVLAHNHPGGLALPSHQDIITTIRLSEVLRPIAIRLLDHIIVAGNDYTSMMQSGMLSEDYIRSIRSNL